MEVKLYSCPISQPKGVVIHNNVYNSEGLAEKLENYDSMIKAYNAVRSGTKTDNDWCSHILDYYKEMMNYKMLEYLKRQGFDVVR